VALAVGNPQRQVSPSLCPNTLKMAATPGPVEPSGLPRPGSDPVAPGCGGTGSSRRLRRRRRQGRRRIRGDDGWLSRLAKGCDSADHGCAASAASRCGEGSGPGASSRRPPASTRKRGHSARSVNDTQSLLLSGTVGGPGGLTESENWATGHPTAAKRAINRVGCHLAYRGADREPPRVAVAA